jgi:hypothetical protein
VRSLGRSVADEEAAFCAALLHDLGLVPPYRRDNRFEIDGADAAREFCTKHRVSPERADLVWRAIALHTSPGIATRLADEIALVHLGAGLDFLGLGLDQVPPQVLDEILEKYPRMKFKSEFRNLLVEQLPSQPRRTSLDLDRRCCPHRRLHVARPSNPSGITNHGGSAVGRMTRTSPVPLRLRWNR